MTRRILYLNTLSKTYCPVHLRPKLLTFWTKMAEISDRKDFIAMCINNFMDDSNLKAKRVVVLSYKYSCKFSTSDKSIVQWNCFNMQFTLGINSR